MLIRENILLLFWLQEDVQYKNACGEKRPTHSSRKKKDTPREEGDFEVMTFSAEPENASCKAVFEDDRQFFF